MFSCLTPISALQGVCITTVEGLGTVDKPGPMQQAFEAIPQPAGGDDRNAIPLYKFGSARVVHHFIPAMPLRVSALSGLGAYMNVLAIESFMDELARAVIRTAAERFGWQGYVRSAGRSRATRIPARISRWRRPTAARR